MDTPQPVNFRKSSGATITMPSVLLALLVIAGCAPGRVVVEGMTGPTRPEGINLSRAYLPLDRIEPSVNPPAKAASPKPLSERAATQVASARGLMADQRYTEAALELERALRYDPNHPEILRTLATLHWQAGNLERAGAHARRVLDATPDDAAAHYILGRCHTAAGDNDAAIQAYRTALLTGDGENREISVLVHYYLAETLAAQEYLTAALEQYHAFEREALSLGRRATQVELVTLLQANGGSAAPAKSRILEKLRRFAEAADALAPAVNASPSDTDLALRYGRLLLQAGRPADGLAVVRAIPSNDEQVLNLLFDIHDRAGVPERMAEDLRSRMAVNPNEPRLILRLADLLARSGRQAEARRELQAHLARMPDSFEIRSRLLELLLEQSEWDEALKVSAEGIALQPERTAALETMIAPLALNEPARIHLLDSQTASHGSAAEMYLRGLIAVRAGQMQQAEDLLQRSRTLDGSFVPARVALANIYLRLARHADALRAAARAEPNVADDARLEMILGETHERLDDITQAELHFKAAMQLNRADSRAMFALARVYMHSDRALQAQRQLRALLEADPRHDDAREMLAMAYLSEGKNDAAMEQFSELARRAMSVTTRARAEALVSQFPRIDPGVYRTALLTAMEQSTPDATTWIAIADSYDEGRETQQKYDAFTQALACDPDNEEAATGLVTTAQRLLRYEEAIERLEALLPRRPNRHVWYHWLLDLYWVVQDYERALSLSQTQESREDIDHAVRDRYRLRIVDSLRLAGRGAEAIEKSKEYAAAEGKDRAWSNRLAELYRLEERPTDAAALYESRFRSDPADKEVLNKLVTTLLAADQQPRAAQYALDWLAEDPANDRAVALLALSLAGTERVDDTNELMRNVLLRTSHPEAFQNLLLLRLRSAQRHHEAIDLIESLLDEVVRLMHLAEERPGALRAAQPTEHQLIRRPDDPSSPDKLAARLDELRSQLAAEHILAKRYREAEQMLLSWLESTKDPAIRVDLLMRLASCYQRQGDDERSTEAMARALALQPASVELSNDVAYGWIDHGVNMEEAERIIRHALSGAPREGAYLDTYGWLLYKKGDFAEAKKWLMRAVRARQGDDPVVRDHLGDTNWRLGNVEEAIEHWSIAAAAVAKLAEDDILAADLRRVRAATPGKIEAARANQTPAVAPLSRGEDNTSNGAGPAPSRSETRSEKH